MIQNYLRRRTSFRFIELLCQSTCAINKGTQESAEPYRATVRQSASAEVPYISLPQENRKYPESGGHSHRLGCLCKAPGGRWLQCRSKGQPDDDFTVPNPHRSSCLVGIEVVFTVSAPASVFFPSPPPPS